MNIKFFSSLVPTGFSFTRCEPETASLNQLLRAAALILLTCICLPTVQAQSNEWTWMGGSSSVPTRCTSTCGQPGVYGSLGTPSQNSVPGGRYGSSTWRDTDGNLWFFGGIGIDSAGTWVGLGDLWKFDVASGLWTWMGGSSTWAEGAVYGTEGTPSAANIPGGRANSSHWTDASGNFWIFAGNLASQSSDVYNSETNDLWKYQPSTNEWTWVGGANTIPQGIIGESGDYGTLGVSSARNFPGTRGGAYDCTDPSGNLWLFGGGGVDSVGNAGLLNDLWVYSPASGQWTWMAGNNTVLPPGNYGATAGGPTPVYGTQGVPAPGNTPGGRHSGSCWFDSGGNLWLFGGYGQHLSGLTGQWNDLWEFNPTNMQWAWMAGNDNMPDCKGSAGGCGNWGVYGSLGISAPGNTPGARINASTWADNQGNFWLFGGSGFDNQGTNGSLNDLWEFSPMTRQWIWEGGSSSIACTPYCGTTGLYGKKGQPDGTTAPGGRDSAMGWTDTAGNLWLFGGEGIDGLGQYGDLNDLWRFEPAASGLPQTSPPEFSLASGIFDSPQTVSISEATQGAAIYVTTDGTPPTLSSQTYSGPLTLTSSEVVEAIAIANGHSISKIATGAYLFPKTFRISLSSAAVQLNAGSSGTITLTVQPENGFNSTVNFSACFGLPSGVTCSISPGTVTPTSANPVTTQVTFTASSTASVRPNSARPWLPAVSLASMFFAFLLRRKGTLQRWLVFVAAATVLGLVTACGGGSAGGSGGGGGGGTPESGTVTIITSSGSLSQTATIAVTVI
jgi:N-acetylneuraminic acid mutarotase